MPTAETRSDVKPTASMQMSAKALEMKGWGYPKHLEGRHFALVVHGDAVGAETLRRTLADWLTDMYLISASRTAEHDGYIGYEEPYATSHQALDKNESLSGRDAQCSARSGECDQARACREIPATG